jgi:UDPglucose 6-dehydrogenase
VKEFPISWANRVKKCASAHENLEEIQVLIVGTEWPEFRDEALRLSDFAKSYLLIIDANGYLLESLRETPMSYLSVGSRKAN